MESNSIKRNQIINKKPDITFDSIPSEILKYIELLEEENQNYQEIIQSQYLDLEQTNEGILALNYELELEIDERKKIEEDLKRHRENLIERSSELVELNKEIRAFSNSVSHDLRAPIRHIDGFITLLQNSAEKKLNKKEKHYLEMVKESAQKMDNLIKLLLEFSRMGRQKLRRVEISANEIVQDIISEIQLDIRDRKINWDIKNLPVIFADKAMIGQAFYNLISNAVKYTSKNEMAEIEIGFRELSYEFEFYIKDNGVGFDNIYSEKLFNIFQRLHSEKDFEGTGIGLANVKRIIHRHGGKIRAKGKIDKGAIFYFTLPKKNYLPKNITID